MLKRLPLRFRFLIAHEAAHIRRGHSGFYEVHHGIRCMKEVPEEPVRRSIDHLDVQATELDADSRARIAALLDVRHEPDHPR